MNDNGKGVRMQIWTMITAWLSREPDEVQVDRNAPPHLRTIALEAMRQDEARKDAERAARTFSVAQQKAAAEKIAARGEAVYDSRQFKDLFGINASVARALWELGYSIAPVPYRGRSGVQVTRG